MGAWLAGVDENAGVVDRLSVNAGQRPPGSWSAAWRLATESLMRSRLISSSIEVKAAVTVKSHAAHKGSGVYFSAGQVEYSQVRAPVLELLRKGEQVGCGAPEPVHGGHDQGVAIAGGIQRLAEGARLGRAQLIPRSM